jgi:acid stress-induced BolA-like protein IbaG/YrbA
MNPVTLKQKLETLAPGTEAQVVDMTGTQDHYQAIVVSPVFEGKLTIEQHRLVFGLVQAEVDSGEIHALTLKTYTPEKFKNLNKNS